MEERQRQLRFGGSPSSRQVWRSTGRPPAARERSGPVSPSGAPRWKQLPTSAKLQRWLSRRSLSRGSSAAIDPVPAGAAVIGIRRQPTFVAQATISWTADVVQSCRALVAVEPHVTEQRSYHGRALFCLPPKNPLRRLCITLIEWRWFDRVVIALIVLNCAFLAQQQPWLPTRSWWVLAELVFQLLFTVELVLKVLALGLALHPGAYLRDSWNWIDFVVVLIGWLAYIPSISNVSVIRSFRIFRPLRCARFPPLSPPGRCLPAPLLGAPVPAAADLAMRARAAPPAGRSLR